MKVVDFHDFPNFSGKFGKLRDPPPYYVQASTHSTSPRTPSGGGPSALMARREQRLSLSRSLADVESFSVRWTVLRVCCECLRWFTRYPYLLQ